MPEPMGSGFRFPANRRSVVCWHDHAQVSCFAAARSFLFLALRRRKPSAASGDETLPTSKLLFSVPGDPRAVNAMPTACAVSPDGKTLAFVHTGYGYEKNGGMQSITLLDAATGEAGGIQRSHAAAAGAEQTFSFGIAWSEDGKRLYVSLGSISNPRR